MKKKQTKKESTDNTITIDKAKLRNVILAILAVIVVIGGLFALSEIAGDRSNDKTAIKDTTTEKDEDKDGNPLTTNDEVWSDDEVAAIKTVTLSGFKEDLEKDTVTIVMLGTDTCTWCVYQKPVLQRAMYLHPEVSVKYLNVANLSNDEYSYLGTLDDQLKSFGTPTFIAIKDGKVTNVSSGARNVDSLVSLFKTMGAM